MQNDNVGEISREELGDGFMSLNVGEAWKPDYKFTTLNLENFTLTIQGSYLYEIDLERYCSASELLHLMLQVGTKPWMDSEKMSELKWALNEALGKVFGLNIKKFPDGVRLDWKNGTIIK